MNNNSKPSSSVLTTLSSIFFIGKTHTDPFRSLGSTPIPFTMTPHSIPHQSSKYLRKLCSIPNNESRPTPIIRNHPMATIAHITANIHKPTKPKFHDQPKTIDILHVASPCNLLSYPIERGKDHPEILQIFQR